MDLWTMRLPGLLFAIGFHIAVEAQSLRTTFTVLDSTVTVHTSHHLLDGSPFPSNGLIVATRDSVVLIDTGWGVKATKEVLRYIQHTLHRPVAACLVTHFHDDRTGGIPALRRRHIRSCGTALTCRLARERGEPVPDVVLGDDTTLTIDGLALTFFHPGAGHAPDNMVVWLPQERLLFGGCFVKSLEAQSLGNIADADLAHWGDAIHVVQQRFPDMRAVIPGHQAWGGPELLEHTLQLLARQGK